MLEFGSNKANSSHDTVKSNPWCQGVLLTVEIVDHPAGYHRFYGQSQSTIELHSLSAMHTVPGRDSTMIALASASG